MYDYSKLTIGIAPTRRDTFPDPADARRIKAQMMPRLRAIFDALGVTVVDIDSINDEGLLVENSDVPAIVRLFTDKGVDAVFFPHANFGQEEAVAKLAAAMKLPVLLWGPRDERPPEMPTPNRQTDIQCGLFASSKALQRYNVPFTYIENCWLGSPVLDREIESFVRVATAVKALRGLRVLQLSTRPRQFLTVKVNESELLEKFGIEIVPVESAEIVRTVKSVLESDQAGIEKRLAEWRETLSLDKTAPEKLHNMAAIEIGIQNLARKYDCRVVSGECWSLFQANFGVRACFIWGDLVQRGLPVSCENDIHGSITQVLVSAIARGETPTFLADVTIRHPDNDNAELLWHCGPFPSAIAKDGAKKEVVECHGSWEIRGGDITLARFDAIGGDYTLFADECRGIDGPWTDGNYVWIEVDDWVRWEKKLIYGPYIHHIVGVHGRFKEALTELCVYVPGLVHDDSNVPVKR